MRRLLDTACTEVLFVSGCVPNQVKFYPDFNHIVLLSARPEVVHQRLSARTGNDYGKARENWPGPCATSRQSNRSCVQAPPSRSTPACP